MALVIDGWSTGPKLKGWIASLLIGCLLGLALFISNAQAGGLMPIEDQYFGATLFINPTSNDVWPPVSVASVDDYESVYGALSGPEIDYGLRAAELFFANGGASLFVIDPHGTSLQDFADALDASIDLPVDLVAIPGAACCQAFPLEHSAIMNLLTDHVDGTANRFALVDAPMNSAESDLIDYRATLSSEHAAIYAPWLTLSDPLDPGSDETVPSSAAVAGVISRIDRDQGIYKSPAGLDAPLAEPPTTELERNLDSSSEALNPLGINLLREFGNPPVIYVWAARTLSDNPARRFIAVARFIRHLKFSIEQSLSVINDSQPGDINPSIIKILIEDYLNDYFLEGAFAGTTTTQAYFVSCSDQPPVLNCTVGVAMQRPAEFDVFQVNIDYQETIFQDRFTTSTIAPKHSKRSIRQVELNPADAAPARSQESALDDHPDLRRNAPD